MILPLNPNPEETLRRDNFRRNITWEISFESITHTFVGLGFFRILFNILRYLCYVSFVQGWIRIVFFLCFKSWSISWSSDHGNCRPSLGSLTSTYSSCGRHCFGLPISGALEPLYETYGRFLSWKRIAMGFIGKNVGEDCHRKHILQ